MSEVKPAQTQHDKRREFWVYDSKLLKCPDGETRVARTERPEDGVHMSSFIHVREALPGEITLNRAEAEDLLHYMIEVRKHLPGDARYIDRIIGRLRPEGTEVSK